VIITDEAHHAQTTVANKIIKNFHPTAVLEFTATGVEDGLKNNRRNQTIVYKYDIKKFLEDGPWKTRSRSCTSFDDWSTQRIIQPK
jgi:type III restriction enzyme